MRSFQQQSYALFFTILCVALSQCAIAQCEPFNCSILPASINTTAGIAPSCVAGSPDCCTLAGRPGFRINGNISGSYFLTKKHGELTACNGASNPSDSLNSFSIQYNAVTNTFSWTASSALAIEQVIVKGGPNSSIYNYMGATRSTDGNLHAPVNPSNCTFYPVSAIEICYRYQLSIVQTIKPTFTRTFKWTIAQSVTPDNWSLFAGDRGTTRYTVALDQTGFTDGAWAAAGTIDIRNNTPFSAQIISLNDTIRPGNIPVGTINCSGTAFTLPPGGALTCSFIAPLPDAASRTATLQVVTLGTVRGRTIATPFTFGNPTTQVNAAINVTDTNGQNRGAINKDSTYSYERPLTCSNQGAYINTATIVETNQKAATTVNIQCFSPGVSTIVNTTFDRSWNWNIDVVSTQKDITLSTGQRYLTQYDATVTATATDFFAITGSIFVKNPHPTRSINLTTVSNTLTGNIAATVTCPTNTIAPGGTLVCTYQAVAPNNSARTATATVNQQNYTYPIVGSPIASGGTRTSATGSVLFPLVPGQETDECAEIFDDSLGTKTTIASLCASDAPGKYTYWRHIGPYFEPEQCDVQDAALIAGFRTLDLNKTGQDGHKFAVIVPCKTGCTLSQTYWSTHAAGGTAAFDDNWNNLPDADGDGKLEGGGETFFLSGRTYLQTLNTASGTNPYWILAKALIATELNLLNGADPAAVQTLYAPALSLIQLYTPAQVPLLPGSIRKNFTVLATLLERYNSGTIGPGSCSTESADDAGKSGGAGERTNSDATTTSGTFRLYPNPAATQITIDFDGTPEEVAFLTVYNAQGMAIMSQKVPSGQTVIALSAKNFSPGFYVFMLQQENKSTRLQKVLVIAQE